MRKIHTWLRSFSQDQKGMSAVTYASGCERAAELADRLAAALLAGVIALAIIVLVTQVGILTNTLFGTTLNCLGVGGKSTVGCEN